MISLDDPSCLDALTDDLSGKISEIARRISDVDPITSLPAIAVWREAYAAMSVKPSKFHSSIEALLRRVKKGDDISTGLPVVDLYNLISVIHGTPMGAYDLDKLPDGKITLRLANPVVDKFEPLGGKADSFPLNDDLAVYAAGSEILCWGINTRDSVRTCVDNQSRSIVFMSEATSGAMADVAQSALSDLAGLVTGLGAPGVVVQDVQIADQSHPRISF